MTSASSIRFFHPYRFCFSHSLRKILGRTGLVCALLVSSAGPGIMAQVVAGPGQVGQWTILTNRLPINPVHAAVMHDGKVLMIHRNSATTPSTAVIWDPATKTASTPFATAYDSMFCDGMVVLPDGRPFVIGGTLAFPPPKFTGQNHSAAFDPSTGKFALQATMAHGRWYPTGTVLNDGRVLTFSGLEETVESDNTVDTNNTVEIFTPDSGVGSWSSPATANWVPPLYPRLHLLKDGRIFYSGSGTQSQFYDVTTQQWSACPCASASTRAYGTSVLLPLRPSGYQEKIMILGGGASATTGAAGLKTTEIIDPLASSPMWTSGSDMSEKRIELNATILPSGNVLVTGGSAANEDGLTASFNADLYHSNPSDPAFNTFTSAGANSIPRLYHSNAILLPDATVILTGSNPPCAGVTTWPCPPAGPGYENRIELYEPAYLFNANGTRATRPSITAPATRITYNTAFAVGTSDPSSIKSVVVIRPTAVTHAFNMEQRLIELSFTVNGTALSVTSPPDDMKAPPGYYLLFILDSAGVPSEGKFVQFCRSTGCL
jgi:hypothetical protein